MFSKLFAEVCRRNENLKTTLQGAPLTYFNDGGGGPSDFLGLKFWPKVIFLGP